MPSIASPSCMGIYLWRKSSGRMCCDFAKRSRRCLFGALASSSRRDGTAIGAVARAMAFEPLLGNKGAQYDGTKFNYIGSTNDEVSVCVAWYTSAASCRALVE